MDVKGDHRFHLLYIYIYEGALKTSYDAVISAVEDYFTCGIQTLQRRWEK